MYAGAGPRTVYHKFGRAGRNARGALRCRVVIGMPSKRARWRLRKVTSRSGTSLAAVGLRVGFHIDPKLGRARASLYSICGRTLLMYAKDRSPARRWLSPLQQHMVYDVRPHAMWIGGVSPRALVRRLEERQPRRARVARRQFAHRGII